MYLKLVMNGNNTTNGTGYATIFETIGNFANRTWTSTSQITSSLINKTSSVVSGTAPTAGIYTSSVTASTTFFTVSITKHHYAKGQNSNQFQARSTVQIYWQNSTTAGLRVWYYDSAGGNGYPTTSTPTFGFTSTGSTAAPRFNGDLYNSNEISVIHCIITDHVFVMQIQTTGTNIQKDYGTCMIADLEYIPSIDNYAYNGNSRYTPQVYCYWFWADTMDQGNGSGATAQNGTGLYRTNYLDQYGTYRNTPLSLDANGTAHYGNQTANNLAPTLNPRPMNRVYQIPVTSGDYAHQLIPLMYLGHSDSTDNFGDPRYSRLMSCYRTSEDLGFTGDMITEGSGNFRIFRIHKCGNQAPGSATFNACYAFPEFNIPYGS